LHGTGEEGLCEEEPGQPEGGRLAMMMPVVQTSWTGVTLTLTSSSTSSEGFCRVPGKAPAFAALETGDPSPGYAKGGRIGTTARVLATTPVLPIRPPSRAATATAPTTTMAREQPPPLRWTRCTAARSKSAAVDELRKPSLVIL